MENVLGELDRLRDEKLRPAAPKVVMSATGHGNVEIAEAWGRGSKDPMTRHHVENLARQVRRLRVRVQELEGSRSSS